jgi:hypothetical protein
MVTWYSESKIYLGRVGKFVVGDLSPILLAGISQIPVGIYYCQVN